MNKKDAILMIESIPSISEIKMLNIRPHVDPEDYCFKVYECDLKEALNTLLKNDYLGEDYLVVSSFGAFEASKAYLPGSYTYAFVTDTKTDKLKRFVAQCDDDTYFDAGNKAEEEENELISAVSTAKASGDQNDVDKAQESLKEYRSSRENYFLSKKINKKALKTVVALGGGVSMDAGQYIATELTNELGRDIQLICAPTVLSVNAAFCYKAAMRDPAPGQDDVAYKDRKYEVKYKSNLIQPVALLIDPKIVLSAGELNVVGAGDLLSCLTASFDWKLNSLVARNYIPGTEKKFNQEICDGAMELIGLLAENIDELNAMRDYGVILKKERNGEALSTDEQESKAEIKAKAEDGLRFICRAYHWVAEQSWNMQHTMWESASEHGMFDYMEYICGTEFTHGQIIGLCVYFMSKLQDNEHERAVNMIKRLKLDITLNNLAAEESNNSKVTPDKLRQCLEGVRAYLTGENYRYTIISAKEMTAEWIDRALQEYYRDFPTDYMGQPNKGVSIYN